MTLNVKTSTNIPESWDENLLKNKLSTGYQLSSWGKIYQESYNSIPLFFKIFSIKLFSFLKELISIRDVPITTKILKYNCKL